MISYACQGVWYCFRFDDSREFNHPVHEGSHAERFLQYDIYIYIHSNNIRSFCCPVFTVGRGQKRLQGVNKLIMWLFSKFRKGGKRRNVCRACKETQSCTGRSNWTPFVLCLAKQQRWKPKSLTHFDTTSQVFCRSFRQQELWNIVRSGCIGSIDSGALRTS